MKLEILLKNIELIVYRNSLSDECFYGVINSVKIYSRGRWVDEKSQLLRPMGHGKFQFELEEEDIGYQRIQLMISDLIHPRFQLAQEEALREPMSKNVQDQKDHAQVWIPAEILRRAHWENDDLD